MPWLIAYLAWVGSFYPFCYGSTRTWDAGSQNTISATPFEKCGQSPLNACAEVVAERPQNLQRFHYSQIQMGVQVRMVVYAAEEEQAATACRAAFGRIAELEDIMSDYRPASELMRLCGRGGGSPVKVSEELFQVLQRAQELAKRSDGAFDVTVGPYVLLWRQARKTGNLPAPEALAEARKRVGWAKLRLDPKARTVRLLAPGMQLDLGGIAKGYALDEALAVLRAHGIRRALLEAGGDIVVGDAPPHRPGWRIKVPHANPPHRFVDLANAAISTSGDTAQYVEIGGVRYSHIVDPRTGLGLTTRLVVTVLAPDGITSDSLATAISVLGETKGRRLASTVSGVIVFVRAVEDVVENDNPER